MMRMLDKNKANFENAFGFEDFRETEISIFETIFSKSVKEVNIRGKDVAELLRKL